MTKDQNLEKTLARLEIDGTGHPTAVVLGSPGTYRFGRNVSECKARLEDLVQREVFFSEVSFADLSFELLLDLRSFSERGAGDRESLAERMQVEIGLSPDCCLAILAIYDNEGTSV
jgi:hypothetical protein